MMLCSVTEIGTHRYERKKSANKQQEIQAKFSNDVKLFIKNNPTGSNQINRASCKIAKV
jgi:hypothetical protein